MATKEGTELTTTPPDCRENVLAVLTEHGPLTRSDIVGKLTGAGQSYSDSTLNRVLAKLPKDAQDRYQVPEPAAQPAASTVHVRLDPAAAEWLNGRSGRMHTGSPHIQARIDLGLWRTALDMELRRIRMTLAQATCLADVMNGHLMSPSLTRPGTVYAEAYDAFEIARDTPIPELSSYGAKHGMDEGELLAYLAKLGPVADHALTDALSRWWAEDHQPTVEGFAAVGLTVVDTGSADAAAGHDRREGAPAGEDA